MLLVIINKNCHGFYLLKVVTVEWFGRNNYLFNYLYSYNDSRMISWKLRYNILMVILLVNVVKIKERRC